MNICRFIQKYAYISYYGKGVSEVMKKMRMKSLLKMTFSLILSMIMAVMMNITAMAVVIDVSSHDGLIDWNSVDEHIEGVIIRIGYGSDYVSQDDKQAIRNMDACERLGIPYGVYIYSYALNMQDVESEIEHTLRMIQGRNPVRGVWFDMEDADGYKESNGIDVYKEGSMLTDFCIRFVSEMYSRGYTTGVYANYNYYKYVLELDRLTATEGFNMWLAHWGIQEPGMDCMMWQFGAYKIDDHEFDGNIFYADYTSPYDKSEIEVDAKVNTSVNVTYRAQISGGYWLPEVVNDEDYAGIQGRAITGITLATDKGYILVEDGLTMLTAGIQIYQTFTMAMLVMVEMLRRLKCIITRLIHCCTMKPHHMQRLLTEAISMHITGSVLSGGIIILTRQMTAQITVRTDTQECTEFLLTGSR